MSAERMIKRGSIVRVKEEHWQDYAMKVMGWCDKYFAPNIHGMVVDESYSGEVVIVNWMPFGYYPLDDPRIAIQTKWLEEA